MLNLMSRVSLIFFEQIFDEDQARAVFRYFPKGEELIGNFLAVKQGLGVKISEKVAQEEIQEALCLAGAYVKELRKACSIDDVELISTI
ncbi:hypothetical protein [Lysobacter antibioticus]|uniref:hypothetical protein n=1 Tax=Lysobacter antibioticus TaxID=84531 RepID=UPI0007172562|nr:hypothetical protein [Lysobacter antibioticus]